MRYVMTIFWSFLLSFMIEFVLSSMLNTPFSFTRGIVLTVIFASLVLILTLVIPKESNLDEMK